MKITQQKIMEKLGEVLDPELAISIVDMGFIYDLKITKNHKINILMTLSSPECPLYSIIEEDIKSKIKKLGVDEKNIKIKLTFKPLWNMDKMSKKGKKMLGI